MSNLLGDIFFGGQSRTDRQQITDLYKTLGPLAKSATESGQAGEGDAMAYYRNLLHGGQAAQTEAIAPQLNAAEQQQQQQRRALSSEGTSRGGGVNAAQQQGADLGTRTSVDALSALVPQAARAEGALGATQTGEGLQAAQQQGTLAEAERRTNLAHQAAEGGDIAKAIAAAAQAFTPTPQVPQTPQSIYAAQNPETENPYQLPEEIPYLNALQPQ